MNKLKEFMDKKGMKASELAEKTGISKRTLELYLGDIPRRDLASAKFETGLKIAKALDINPYDLL